MSTIQNVFKKTKTKYKLVLWHGNNKTVFTNVDVGDQNETVDYLYCLMCCTLFSKSVVPGLFSFETLLLVFKTV